MTGTNVELMREGLQGPILIGVLIRWAFFTAMAMIVGATLKVSIFVGLPTMVASYLLFNSWIYYHTNEREEGFLPFLLGLLFALIAFGIFIGGMGLP